MTVDEMQEKVKILVKAADHLEDYAQNYKRSGRRDDLEGVEKEARVVTAVSTDLQEWHR